MKRYVHAADTNWIDWKSIEEDEYFDITGEEFEDQIWQPYLGEAENKVNEKLQIFPEPSTQCGMGSVFIWDESGKDRWSAYDDDSKVIDFYDWCEKEFNMARKAKNANEYAKLYEDWMRSVCEI